MKKSKLYFLIVFGAIFFCSGCDEEELTTTETVNFVWQYAIEHPDGFTLNIETYKPVTKGISVAYSATQNSFSKESLSGVVEHALEHDAIVGGWLNEKDSLYYFDSDKVFPDTALAEALEFAIENEQYAIYDITNDSTIWVSDCTTTTRAIVRYQSKAW